MLTGTQTSSCHMLSGCHTYRHHLVFVRRWFACTFARMLCVCSHTRTSQMRFCGVRVSVLLAALMDSELRQKVAEEYNLRKTQIQMNIKLAIRKRDKLAATRCCLSFSIPHPSFFLFFWRSSSRATMHLGERADTLMRELVLEGEISSPTVRATALLQLFTNDFYYFFLLQSAAAG